MDAQELRQRLTELRFRYCLLKGEALSLPHDADLRCAIVAPLLGFCGSIYSESHNLLFEAVAAYYHLTEADDCTQLEVHLTCNHQQVKLPMPTAAEPTAIELARNQLLREEGINTNEITLLIRCGNHRIGQLRLLPADRFANHDNDDDFTIFLQQDNIFMDMDISTETDEAIIRPESRLNFHTLNKRMPLVQAYAQSHYKDRSNTIEEPPFSEARRLQRAIWQVESALRKLHGGIEVVCRVRPLLQADEAHAAPSHLLTNPDTCHFVRAQSEKVANIDLDGHPNYGCDCHHHDYDFDFDQVFNADNTQHQVFERLQHLIDLSARGGTAVVFAYGITGAGKSHTLVDGDNNTRNNNGLAFLTVEALLARSSGDGLSVAVLEIHNDIVYDLLSSSQTKKKRIDIRLHDDQLRTPYAAGLSRVDVNTTSKFLSILQCTRRRRAVSATRLNECSSQSHVIIDITMREETNSGRFWLVDLAGAERINNLTGASPRVLKEARYINKSLASLGSIFEAIEKQRAHVPYRDCKCGHLLQAVLQDTSCQCLFIFCTSPAWRTAPETFAALNLSKRLRNITSLGGIGLSEKQKLADSIFETVCSVDMQPTSTFFQALQSHIEKSFEQNEIESIQPSIVDKARLRRDQCAQVKHQNEKETVAPQIEVTQLRRELDDARKDIQAAEWRARMTRIEVEALRMKSTTGEISQDQICQETEILNSREEVAQLRQDLVHLRFQAEAAEKKLTSLSSDISTVRKPNSSIDNDTIKSLRLDLDTALRLVQATEQRAIDLKSDINQFRNSKNDDVSVKSSTTATETIEQLRSDLVSTKEKVIRAEQRAKNLNAALAKYQFLSSPTNLSLPQERPRVITVDSEETTMSSTKSCESPISPLTEDKFCLTAALNGDVDENAFCVDGTETAHSELDVSSLGYKKSEGNPESALYPPLLDRVQKKTKKNAHEELPVCMKVSDTNSKTQLRIEDGESCQVVDSQSSPHSSSKAVHVLQATSPITEESSNQNQNYDTTEHESLNSEISDTSDDLLDMKNISQAGTNAEISLLTPLGERSMESWQYYCRQQSKLLVTVHSARNLFVEPSFFGDLAQTFACADNEAQLGLFAHPFVVAQCGDMILSSRFCEDVSSRNPTWEADFVFPDDNPESTQIKLFVFFKNMWSAPSLLGQCTLNERNITGLSDGKGAKLQMEWFKIKPCPDHYTLRVKDAHLGAKSATIFPWSLPFSYEHRPEHRLGELLISVQSLALTDYEKNVETQH